MHQAQRAGHFRIQQFLVKIGNLRRQQQAFVNNGSRRKRRKIEEALLLEIRRRHGGFRALAHHVQLALERVLIHLRAALDKNLFDIGLRRPGQPSNGVSV